MMSDRLFMRNIDMQTVFDYLTALERNNQREWYHANKLEYKLANEEFEKFIGELISAIGKSDVAILHNTPKNLTFRLVRDTRYSADKSPYNPTFRAHISAKGKLPIPVGYFIRIKPDGQSFLGGGLFADMFKDATTMIRDYIVDNSEEWENIITDPEFVKYFTVKGEALKRVPRGYDKEDPQAEFLKYKSWYIEFAVTDKEILSPDFVEYATKIFRLMQPFNSFLNRALEGFILPKR